MKAILADFREMLSEEFEYKELLYQLTLRDIRLRYKQTVMGFGWAIFMPLLNTAVFSVIFTRVAPLDTGVPLPAVVLLWPCCVELLCVWRQVRDEFGFRKHAARHQSVFPA